MKKLNCDEDFSTTDADKNGEPGANRFNCYVETARYWHNEADALASALLADREKLEKAREAACKIESLRNVHGIELRNQVDAPWEELGNALDLLREVIK